MDVKQLAKTIEHTELYAFLESVKQQVADVRTPIAVKPEVEIEVRRAVCEVIDDLIVNKLKTSASDIPKAEDNWQ